LKYVCPESAEAVEGSNEKVHKIEGALIWIKFGIKSPLPEEDEE
jgi:hypothetical protein